MKQSAFGARISQLTYKKIISLYDNGMSMAKIADTLRMCSKTVAKVINASGIRRETCRGGYSRQPRENVVGGQYQLAEESSTVYLVGFAMPPAWAVPYIEARRVKMEQAR